MKSVLDHIQGNGPSKGMITSINILMFMISRKEGTCKEENGGIQKELYFVGFNLDLSA